MSFESEGGERRFLNNDEISYLLEWLTPNIFSSPYVLTNRDVTNAWRRILKIQIQREKFDPSKLKDIRDKIERKFIKSMIEPNTPVGKITGTSIGEKSTQFTLKLKSNASSSSSGKSVKVSALFQALINAYKNPPGQQVEIRFKDKVSFKELYNRRREFQRIFLTEDYFIEKMEIVSTELNYSEWYDTFETVYGISFDSITSKCCLQIKLNVQALYDYRISLEEIAKYIKSSSNYVEVILSPQHIGIIDVYPTSDYIKDIAFRSRIKLLKDAKRSFLDFDNGWELDEEGDILEEEITDESSRSSRTFEEKEGEEEEEEEDEEEEEEDEEEEEEEDEEEEEEPLDPEELKKDLNDLREKENLSDEDMEQLFLNTVISPLISSKNYGSNGSIPEVFIAWTPYSATIKRTEKHDNSFIVEFNHEVLNHSGIKIEEVNNWLISKGWKIRELKSGRYYMTKGSKGPMEELKSAAENINEFENVIKPFIETNTGFVELIILPGVDTDHSYTDSAKIMKSIYGIEVARVSMNKSFNDIFSGDHYVLPVHPALIIAFMTFTGEVIPITRNAYRQLKIGPIEQATFEEQHGTLLKGAMFPKSESVQRVGTSVIFGSAPPIGTGAVKVFEKPEYQKIREAADLKKTNIKEAERQKFVTAMDELDEVEFFEMPESDEGPEIEVKTFSEEIFIPKIVLPSETEDIRRATEPIHVIPADSAIPPTVQIETSEPKESVSIAPTVQIETSESKEPVSVAPKRLVRAVRMK